MIVSYCNPLGDGKRHKVKAEITTAHSASSYGQPVLVVGGDAIDLMSWVGCGYQVIKASKKELESLTKMGL